MRRIVLWLLSTITVVVLLFGYHTSTNETAAAPTSTSTSTATSSAPTRSSSAGAGAGGGSSDPSDTSSSSSSSSSSSTTTTTSTDGPYAGSTTQTRWGPVQVQITTKGSTITAVKVLQQPSGNPRDTEINAYALPVLIDETLQAQAADIDMVSGATVTSDGYVRSLQSALDQAGI